MNIFRGKKSNEEKEKKMNVDEKTNVSFDEQIRKATEKVFNKEKEKLDKKTIRKNLIISLYGDVSAGKSTTINALTGKKLAEVNAIAGWTKEIKLHPFAENVYIADTPGLNDINEENSKKSEEFVEKNADIVLFFFKVTGTTRYEYEALRNIAKTKKPIIAILNYIDLWLRPRY